MYVSNSLCDFKFILFFTTRSDVNKSVLNFKFHIVLQSKLHLYNSVFMQFLVQQDIEQSKPNHERHIKLKKKYY